MFVSKNAMGTNSNGPSSFIPSQAVTAAATDSVDGDTSVFFGPRTVTQ
jgi:hypothetical protein